MRISKTNKMNKINIIIMNYYLIIVNKISIKYNHQDKKKIIYFKM